ncbi:MAG TPA: SET domain-containing protein [Methyloceanibacter sp.]|nr:SET domain-containing protein [Methyloceanibacter sp.]
MSPDSTAYLSDKCEVKNREVAGGYSVIARQVIDPGELIGVWSGRIVTADHLDTLPVAIRRHTVQIEEALYLASTEEDAPPDFINHSCEPNAGLDGQIAIVSLRHILPGEEVTIDYAMCDGSPYDEFDCGCGSKICRGKVTGDDWRNPALWERYADHFSPYLQRRIDALRRENASRRPRRKGVLALVGETRSGVGGR